MSNDKRNNMLKLLTEREEFLVIALTGRVGSGCSEAAEIFSSSIEQMMLPSISPGDRGLQNDAERDKRILVQYFNSHWLAFDVIKVRTIIATFFLKDMASFTNHIAKLTSENRTYKSKSLIENIQNKLKKNINTLFTQNPFNTIDDILKRNYISSDAKPMSWQNFTSEIKQIQKETNITQELWSNCENILTNYDQLFQKLYKEYLSKICPMDRNQYLKNVNDCISTFSAIIAYVWFKKNDNNVWNELSKINDSLLNFEKNKLYFLDFVFVHDIMPAFASVVHDTLTETNPENFTRLFQKYGNCIRKYGTIIYNIEKQQSHEKNTENNKQDIFEIPRKINQFIKVLRHPFSRSISRPERVVIDALKNPFEAFYLRERYSAFYLFAISADESIRIERLTKRMSLGQINRVDWNEYPSISANILDKYKNQRNNHKTLSDAEQSFAKEVNGEDTKNNNESCELFDFVRKEAYEDKTYPFILQDVESCIQNADVFISNTGTKYNANQLLKWDIIRNVCLTLYPGLVQPTPVERCMQIAFSAKVNSGCLSRQVGAVVTDSQFNILSIGWNDVPCGDISCARKNLEDLYMQQDNSAYTYYELNNKEFRKRIEEKYQENTSLKEYLCGLPLRYCFKDIHSDIREPMKSRAMHAEEKSLSICGKECEGGFLFTTSSPCEMCSKNAKNHKIKDIYYIEPYPGISEYQYSRSGDPENIAKHILFTGAIGRAYTQMYTPIMPHKDILASLKEKESK